MKNIRILIAIVLVIGLAGCAAMTGSSEGDLGPNKMRKSPCAERVGEIRHV